MKGEHGVMSNRYLLDFCLQTSLSKIKIILIAMLLLLGFRITDANADISWHYNPITRHY
jgi:hypothetical protein